ncbi:MAG: methionyl-tRNA formyltransferase [Salibacteraceae bacterium]
MQNKLRIVFFGTPEFAATSLAALVNAGHNVVGVVTAVDKPAGRGKKLQPSAIKQYAEEQGLTLLQPPNLKAPAFIDSLRALNADIHVVVAFRMLPEVVWNMPPLGTYNVHASLLPDYRGAAPINWAIINGETVTGVTTFKLKHEIDTGNILLQSEVPIEENDTAGSLHDKLMHEGANLLLQSVDLIAAGKINLKPQPKGVGKHAPKIQKSDCLIKLDQTAEQVRNFIRGMAPFPGAFLKIEGSSDQLENWKVFEVEVTQEPSTKHGLLIQRDDVAMVSANDYWLKITTMQTPGKKRMTSTEFLRGYNGKLDSLTIAQ